VEVLVFRGRRHLYEGLSMADAAATVRVGRILGARRVILVSAVGSAAEGLPVGSWVWVEDHLNLMGRNPLEGVRTADGPPFIDLCRLYRRDLYDDLRRRLGQRGISLRRGVVASFPGPTYETPAEVRMARQLGADVVSMSMVPEAVWARFLGMEVCALGHVTNPGAGLETGPLEHQEVLRQSALAVGELDLLLEEIMCLATGCGEKDDSDGNDP
jgi:purine-nucleoside phosphorylase